MKISSDAPVIDTALLAGFRYACRPDCGLCCFAEPHLESSEKPALLQLRPQPDFVHRGREEYLASRPEGGACTLLQGSRCRGHAARPSVCREFPLTAHAGLRVQVTAVLTCPGVELTSLEGFPGTRGLSIDPGFADEVEAVRARAEAHARPLLAAGERRRRRIVRALEAEGRWIEEEEVREHLRSRIPVPTTADFPSEDPPSADEGVELLPLVWAGHPGPLAFASALGGWELMELREAGGSGRSLGVFPAPSRPPACSEAADRMLRGYLRYWLERDALFGSIHLLMLERPDGDVEEWIAAELRRIGALATSRAQVLAVARRGPVDRLAAADLEEGIRATDQDLLDRTTWGSRL